MRTESELIATQARADFARAVRQGLCRDDQKQLPCKYFYDPVGSALFEVISVLPEYGLTRADERILQRYAGEIVGHMGRPVAVAELGSGSGKKTRHILEALCAEQPTTYYPIEISEPALAACALELSAISNLTIQIVQSEYLDGLREASSRRASFDRLLVLFLGSTIGNFTRAQADRFLGEIRSLLKPADALLLGTDLEKPVDQLLAAYDDAIGVTAAFNLNLLARINRELDADFQPVRFRHVAAYNASERRIEMYLRSTTAQTIEIPKAECRVTLKKDETILTEYSYRYASDEVVSMGIRAGFECRQQWFDHEWPFAESLLVV
ncbi:MAG TPA: L-histidine N(alpha)-methyltransferase [Acidobacteriota bacterium]|jgi:dimethylhistidine N-methyltransferase